jgi:ribonuclease P protein component
LPRAVARNRFRRLVRESFRRHQHQLAGLDVIVIARAAAATLSNDALLAQLDSHWPTLQRPCEASSSG